MCCCVCHLFIVLCHWGIRPFCHGVGDAWCLCVWPIVSMCYRVCVTCVCVFALCVLCPRCVASWCHRSSVAVVLLLSLLFRSWLLLLILSCYAMVLVMFYGACLCSWLWLHILRACTLCEVGCDMLRFCGLCVRLLAFGLVLVMVSVLACSCSCWRCRWCFAGALMALFEGDDVRACCLRFCCCLWRFRW